MLKINLKVNKSKNMKINTETNIEFLSFGYFIAPDKDWVHMARSQDSYQIFCVKKGILYISDDSNDYTVPEGEYLIMPPCKNQHGWKASECEFYYFHFYVKGQDRWTDLGTEVMAGDCKNIHRIEALYSMLSYEQKRKVNNNHIIALILCELKNPPADKKYKGSSNLCETILSYIRYAEAGKLNISYLSEKFMYHEKYLSQKFKKETGKSLKVHLKEELINRGKHLLKTTGLSISEISDILCYSDVHSFSHVFKRETGISPREYRDSESR